MIKSRDLGKLLKNIESNNSIIVSESYTTHDVEKLDVESYHYFIRGKLLQMLSKRLKVEESLDVIDNETERMALKTYSFTEEEIKNVIQRAYEIGYNQDKPYEDYH